MTSVIPVRKVIGISAFCVMIELQVPSNNWSPIGGTAMVVILWFLTKVVSIKQCEEPESIRVQIRRVGVIVKVIKSDSGSERVDVLSQTNAAMQLRSMQPSAQVA